MQCNELLKQCRAKAKMTQMQAAVGAGVTERTYQRWEKGDISPSFDVVSELVSKVFNLQIEVCLG